MVDRYWVKLPYFDVGRAIVCLGCLLRNPFDGLRHVLLDFIIITSYGPSHDGFVWKNVVSVAALNVANGEHDVLSAVHASRFDGVKSI